MVCYNLLHISRQNLHDLDITEQNNTSYTYYQSIKNCIEYALEENNNLWCSFRYNSMDKEIKLRLNDEDRNSCMYTNMIIPLKIFTNILNDIYRDIMHTSYVISNNDDNNWLIIQTVNT